MIELMRALKAILIVLGLTVLGALVFYILVGFTSSLFIEPDDEGNNYGSVFLAVLAIPAGAVVGLVVGLLRVLKRNKSI